MTTLGSDVVQKSGSCTESSLITIDSDDEVLEQVDPIAHEDLPRPYDKTIKQPKLLLGLPIEVLKIITDASGLSNVDRHSLKMTTHSLRRAEFETTKMSKSEYLLFNQLLEAGLPNRRHLLAQNLLCTKCLSFLPKTAFPDARAKPLCLPPRVCVQCGIACGHFNRQRFWLGGKKYFACGACKVQKPVSALKVLDKNTQMRVWQRFGTLRSIEMRVKMDTRRWCKECWKTIESFWDFVGKAGKMKEVMRPYESDSN